MIGGLVAKRLVDRYVAGEIAGVPTNSVVNLVGGTAAAGLSAYMAREPLSDVGIMAGTAMVVSEALDFAIGPPVAAVARPLARPLVRAPAVRAAVRPAVAAPAVRVIG